MIEILGRNVPNEKVALIARVHNVVQGENDIEGEPPETVQQAVDRLENVLAAYIMRPVYQTVKREREAANVASDLADCFTRIP